MYYQSLARSVSRINYELESDNDVKVDIRVMCQVILSFASHSIDCILVPDVELTTKKVQYMYLYAQDNIRQMGLFV